MAKQKAQKTASGSGVIEETTLNWTDLTGAKTGATAKGSNKFYKAQILKEGSGFKIVFNYGRVGQSGQTQTEQAPTLDAAKKIFEKKINAKIKKGYHRIEMRSENEEVKKAKAHGVEVGKKTTKKKKKKAATDRKFHKEVEGLLGILYGSTGKAIKAGLSSTAGASESAPLGNLSDSQLEEGADLLDEMGKLVESGKGKKQRFIDLTNDFLSAIPRNIDHAIRGGKLDIKLVLLDTEERIKKEREFLMLLRDAHLQKEVFAEAAEAEDPVSVWYDGLNCEVEFVENGTKEFKEVKGYFDKGQSPMNANFHNKLEVKKVWRFERNDTKAPFLKFADTVDKKGSIGVVRAWHGTRTENVMGIAKTGLLMPDNLPKGVHITGKVFGLGIYHAPCWSDAGDNRKEGGKTYKRYNGALKSMNYTSLRGAYWNDEADSNRGYLFLEELALGVPQVTLKPCWGRKQPTKGADFIYARAFGNPQLSHDEVVVFDERASRMTHLLEIGHKGR
ncbi:WGR domain-containing protein [Myxococcota bacterium]